MSNAFDQLVERTLLSPLHTGLGEMIGRLHCDNDGDRAALPSIQIVAALASEQLQRGHVCLDLRLAESIVNDLIRESAQNNSGQEVSNTSAEDPWSSPTQWDEQLKASPVVISASPDQTVSDLQWPLVFDVANRRLYLARYWFYQQRLAAHIQRRLSASSVELDTRDVTKTIRKLFPNPKETASEGQCIGAVNAVDRSFAVISGGPGTGKTTTVAKLLALRLALHPKDKPDPRILIMAPTGKAAQRLNESLNNSLNRAVAAEEIDASIQQRLAEVKACTIHRGLGWTPKPPERGGPFRHTEGDPLEADIVIVDEASMVDLALMYRLMSAVPAEAQVILMGDRDQLVSVEAGGVLSDLCGAVSDQDQSALTPARAAVIAERTGLEIKQVEKDEEPLVDAVVHLTHSHRFKKSSTLGQLSIAIREGKHDAAIKLVTDADPQEVHWIQSTGHRQSVQEIVKLAEAGFGACLSRLTDERTGSLEVLQQLGRFRVLCALRGGTLGVNAINRAVEQRLIASGKIQQDPMGYIGKPVMVVRNDYPLELFNGDVGLVTEALEVKDATENADPDFSSPRLSVLFEDHSTEECVRRVAPALVPSVETCYAMTIHKSQGSEFNEVVVVLPDRSSPLLTRELLYTGITRVADVTTPSGRKPGRLTIIGSESVLRETIKQQIRRTSGLHDAIVQMQAVRSS